LSTLFVDTSALAKRYLSEVGSAWVRSVTAPAAGHVVIIAGVTGVEMFSLLARRGRDSTLAAANITLLGNAFLLHAEHEYLVVPPDGRVLAQARGLVGRYPLRTLDAIQLASAQTAGAILDETITFISSDRNLLAAASTEGLLTDDPLMHP
jgi:uncharacterized protein